MVQDSRIIDLRKSYLPGDPNTFPTKLPNTGGGEGDDRADADGGRFPIMPYDGYNFMPTPYGYSSFFGTTASLGIDPLVGNVDDVFIIQKVDFTNFAIGLKDDGIWTKDLNSGGAWTHVITLTVPPAGTHKNWSRCVIDQDIYVYRQGEPSYWIAGASNSYVFTPVVPSGLNMLNQLGIFKAGGRLGFWDSLNSIAWSAFENKSDFNDSLETLAGKAIFQDIVGRIVTVLQHGDGFIVYCTKAIVSVTRNVESPMLFLGDPVFNNNGIAYRDQVAMGDPDTSHFVLSTTGFCEISNGKSTYSIPDISRYFKEQREPMTLRFVNGKFLFFCFISPDYNVGRLNYNYVEGNYVAPQVSEWAAAKAAVNTAKSPSASQTEANNAVVTVNKKFDQVFLNSTYGYSNYQQGTPGQVPIWQDHLVSCIPLADLAAFKPYADTHRSEQYFFDTGFTNGGLTLVDGSTGFFLPTKGPDLAASFNTSLQLQPNQNNFFSKQDTIFYYEDLFFTAWLQAVEERIKSITASSTPAPIYHDGDYVDPSGGGSTLVETDYNISTPFVNPTFYSESNKYYGVANKSAWLQRSLTQGQQVKVRSHVTSQSTGAQVLGWKLALGYAEDHCNIITIASSYRPNRAAAIASASQIVAQLNCEAIAHGNSFQNPHFVTSIVDVGDDNGGTSRQIVMGFSNQSLGNVTYVWEPFDLETNSFVSRSTVPYRWRSGREMYKSGTTSSQVFSDISSQVAFNTCVHKELGYTSIIGHGHYNSFGTFIQDNATAEATDFVDICLASPLPIKKPFFGGGAVTDGIYTNASELGYTPVNGGPFYGQGSVTIGGVSYNYPIGDYIDSAVIPATLAPSILLQPGSIEPIYPTFVGAFVYDIHLKKWGKLKIDFKNLLDIFPINTTAGEGIFAYENFLPKVGARIPAGSFPIFDEYPLDSELVFGKVGYYRKGFTDLEEVIFQHRSYRNGTLQIEPSIDSRNIDNSIVQLRPYTDAALIREGLSISARWYNIVFRKAFDLTHLEVKTVRRGRR